MEIQFYQWLIVKIILIGLVIQFVVLKLYDWLKRVWLVKKREKGFIKYTEHLQSLMSLYTRYVVLGQNEALNSHYFDTENSDAVFIIPFPEKEKEDLIRYQFLPLEKNKEELRTNKLGEDLMNNLYALLKLNGIAQSEQEEFLQNVKEATAKKFIMDIQKGGVRFNKYLYGVSKYKNGTISLYESDYFTFKTITNVYNALKEKNEGHVILGDNPAPFLNSIGVGGFVIVNRGEGDELIWGFRGPNCQSGGYWHFSYDETFTHDDAEVDQAASLNKCIKRALTEELGIHPEEQLKCVTDMRLIDCGIIRTEGNDNRYEFEVCSFVRISLSDEYTFRDFIQNYRFAKDAELETRCLKLVKIAELNTFMKENENRMSPEAQVLALKIQALANYGLLKSDYRSFNDISNT